MELIKNENVEKKNESKEKRSLLHKLFYAAGRKSQ